MEIKINVVLASSVRMNPITSLLFDNIYSPSTFDSVYQILITGQSDQHIILYKLNEDFSSVLIRKKQNSNKAEVVLLDHGLYQELPQDERKNLCYLWKSIVLHDEKGMHKYSEALGVEDPYLFAEILMQRPLKLHKYQLKLSLNEEDMRYMTYMARKRFDRIILALRQMPKNMLLVIRNMNTIRAIAKDHGDPVDRFTLMARSATQGAFVEKNAGVLKKLSGFKQRIVFEINLWTDYFKFITFRTFYNIMLYLKKTPDLNEMANQMNVAV